MPERDLELGISSPRPAKELYDADLEASEATDWQAVSTSNNGRTFLGTDGLSAIAEKLDDNTSREHVKSEDEEYIQLPRRKVEQLMGMWIDVLQQSLKVESHTKPLLPLSDPSSPNKHHRRSSYTSGQYPPIVRLAHQQPWSAVERMSEAEIRAENGYRRMRRSEWRSSERMADLEDSWRYLWEPAEGVDKGLFQWPGSAETRTELQLELADALVGNDRIVAVNMYMQRDFRAISTWISMIGLRLNEQYRSFAINRHPDIGPVLQIKVLIECIWACNAFDPNTSTKKGYREGPRLSNVLTACYRRGVLHRPEKGFDDYVTTLYLQKHCQMVRRALHLINLLRQRRIATYSIANLRDAQDVWDMPLPDLEAPSAPVLAHRPSDLREGAEVFLRIDDFNLRDLQTLGHLQIQWTSYWDEHLQLETSSTANILKIFWFQPRLGRYLVEKSVYSPFFIEVDSAHFQREYILTCT